MGLPVKTSCKVLLDSYKDNFEKEKGSILKAEEEPCDKQPYSLEFDLKPMQSLIMEFSAEDKKKVKQQKEEAQKDKKNAEEEPAKEKPAEGKSPARKKEPLVKKKEESAD